MTHADFMASGKCHAHNKRGEPCGARALLGQRVCHYHGGKSPQALAKAEERMRAMVHPALSRLAELIAKADQDSVSLNATRYVLDWAGFRPSESENAADVAPMRITVVFDRANQDDEPKPTLALNGHTTT